MWVQMSLKATFKKKCPVYGAYLKVIGFKKSSNHRYEWWQKPDANMLLKQ